MMTRMKLYLLFLIIIACGVVLKAGNVRPLPEIMTPNIIAVNENMLYISDRYSIIVYSLDDFSVLHRFGGKGEGPREFRFLPFFGDNYLLEHEEYEQNSRTPVISIFDKEFNKIKTICRGEKNMWCLI